MKIGAKLSAIYFRLLDKYFILFHIKQPHRLEYEWNRQMQIKA